MTATISPDQCEAHIRQFGYAGDVTPDEAMDMLEASADAVLVDVRTAQEWEQVGLPNLEGFGKVPVRLSWMYLPSGEVNGQFVAEFSKLDIAQDVPVLLLCRSGGRSQAAAKALSEAGYRRCFNISGGFEGPDGWIATNLPWKQ